MNAATIPANLHQTLFFYVKKCVGVLKDAPPIVLNREDYDTPTVEIGDLTVHLEIREIKAIVKREALVAVVGRYVSKNNYPNAPDDTEWVEIYEHQQVWGAAAEAVCLFAADRMMERIDTAEFVEGARLG